MLSVQNLGVFVYLGIQVMVNKGSRAEKIEWEILNPDRLNNLEINKRGK